MDIGCIIRGKYTSQSPTVYILYCNLFSENIITHLLDHRHKYLYSFGRFTQGSGIIIVRGGFIFVNLVDDLHVHPNEPQTWFLHFSYYMYTSNSYLSY